MAAAQAAVADSAYIENYVAEVLAAVGLTVPGVTRILPWLVAWAADGILIVTVSATVFHLARGEMSSAAITLVLTAMAACVAYMRGGAIRIVVPLRPNDSANGGDRDLLPEYDQELSVVG